MRILLTLLLILPAGLLQAAGTADFYLVDVGHGNGMLIVSPSGESLLLDAGPQRSAQRTLAVLKSAGIRRIDYLVATHYHEDHIGAIPAVAGKVPVRNFVDHGPSLESGQSEEWWRQLKGSQYRPGMGRQYDEMFARYRETIGKGKHVVVKPGDKIPIKGLDVLVVSAAGRKISAPLKGAGAPNAACAGTELRIEDYEEDGQSIGVLISVGKFRFISLGDLTWNLSYRFFCPNNPVGTVDAYWITHHARTMPREAGENSWALSSCPKAEVYALRPRVALLSLGLHGHRAGTPEAIAAVHSSPGLEDVWQTERIVEGGQKDHNSPEQFIANLGGQNGQTHFIKLSARPDGSFSVTNSRNGYTKQYPPAR